MAQKAVVMKDYGCAWVRIGLFVDMDMNRVPSQHLDASRSGGDAWMRCMCIQRHHKTIRLPETWMTNNNFLAELVDG